MKKENIVWDSKVDRFMLIYLNKKEIDFISNIAKEIKFDMGGVRKRLIKLRNKGLIESIEIKGKKRYPFVYMTKKNKYYKITNKGKEIVELLLKIKELTNDER